MDFTHVLAGPFGTRVLADMGADVVKIQSTPWMDESLAHGDFKEGVASFVERRPPKFARIKVD